MKNNPEKMKMIGVGILMLIFLPTVIVPVVLYFVFIRNKDKNHDLM